MKHTTASKMKTYIINQFTEGCYSMTSGENNSIQMCLKALSMS